MRFTNLVTLTMTTIVVSHCSDADFVGGRVGVVEDKRLYSEDQEGEPNLGDESQQVDRNTTDVADATPTTKSFELTASTTENSHKKDEPIELLFLLDNSQSMADNVKKLADSVAKMFESFNAAQIPYRARILPIDRLTRVLQDVPGHNVVAPPKVYMGAKADYNRDAQHEDIYLSVEPFSTQRSSDTIAAAIEESTKGTISFDNEPLVCGAMDYVNWSAFTGNERMKPYKFAKNQKLHIVALSDEDNDTVIETVDRLTGQVTSSKDLVCYKEGEIKQECKKKYFNDYASWTGYGYEWKEAGYDRYKYEVNYEADLSLCEKQGSTLENDFQVRLYATKKCSKERITCQDKSRRNESKRYSCSLGGGAAQTQSSNLEASKSGQCKVANTFRCELLVDGSKVWQEVNRAQALNIIARKAELGLSCEPILDGSTGIASIATNSSNYNNEELGYHSCEAWTCEEAAPVVSFDTVTIDKAVYDANPDNYQSCGSPFWLDYNADGYAVYKPETNASGKLTGLVERSCSSVPGYVERTVSKYRISDAFFCEGTLADFDFTGKAIQFGDRKADARPRATKNSGTYPSPQSQNDVVADLKLTDKNILGFKEIHEVKADQLVRRFFTYDRENDYKSYPSFKKLTAADDPRVGAQRERVGSPEFNANPPMNGAGALSSSEYATKGVKIDRVEEADGSIVQESCSEPVVDMVEYRPTPENFLKVMEKLHPSKTVTWHSIVNTDGKSCADAAESNVSQGAAYLELTSATKGLHADICEPDFNTFVEKLAYEVITEVNLLYDIPQDAADKKVKSAFNKTKGKKIKFTIVDKQIRFEKGAIDEGDVVVVSY